MTRKKALLQYGEKLVSVRESYAQQCRDLKDSTDFSEEYKAKCAAELAEECRKALERTAGNAVSIIDAVLNLYMKEREKVLARRNNQAYNLQLQNTLYSLKTAAHALSDSDVEDLKRPFEQDAVAMATLKACALQGGMNPVKAERAFNYVRNPHVTRLQNMKTAIERYAASADPRGANSDDLSISFMLSYGLSTLPDDLITLDSSEAKEAQP